jgi:hypothetical protein
MPGDYSVVDHSLGRPLLEEFHDLLWDITRHLLGVSPGELPLELPLSQGGPRIELGNITTTAPINPIGGVSWIILAPSIERRIFMSRIHKVKWHGSSKVKRTTTNISHFPYFVNIN